jgi:hypothetical protein
LTNGWAINWDCGSAEVQALGGMLGPAWFKLDNGARVQPFFVAPWAQDLGASALPGVLQNLRGEWPCVPHGVERDEPVSGWQGNAPAIGDGALHGHGANNDWRLIKSGPDFVEIAIDYPASHPVRGLSRRISGRTGQAALDFELTVEVRADIDLGLALHPTFRLPDSAGAASIHVAGLSRGWVFPEPLDETGRAAPGARFDRLDRVPGANGEPVDFTCLPFAAPNEDLLQMHADGGSARLANQKEGWAATISYDADLFPAIALWVTNRGWKQFPWSGRTVAVGIEPVRAAFDLGQCVSADPKNPMAKAGVPTAIHLAAGETLQTRYTISVEAVQ